MNIGATLMFDEEKKQRIARIIELPIPMDFFDMLEDLTTHYGSQEKAILEAIKAHHKEKFGTLDDFKYVFTPPSTRAIHSVAQMNTPVTDGKLAKIRENGKKFEERTQKNLEKVDNLLEKLSDLSSINELKEEISSVKSMIQGIQSTGVVSSRPRRSRADLSSLDVSVVDSDELPLAPPERPSLESVLDTILLFDEDEEDDSPSSEETEEKEQDKDS